MNVTAKAYIGTTRFIEDESELVPKFGFNGDTAYLLNSAFDKVIGEFTKRNGKWIKVNTNGNNSNPDIDIDQDSDFSEVIEQVKKNTSDINNLKTEIPDVSNFITEDDLPDTSKFVTIDSELFNNLLQKVSELETKIENLEAIISSKPGLSVQGTDYEI